MLSQAKIEKAFLRFSNGMVEKCETDSQARKARDISRILWLLLIKGQDTEKNVYRVLRAILKDHGAAISFGSLYFFVMKKELTKSEIKRLRNHYNDPVRFQALSDWMRNADDELSH